MNILSLFDGISCGQIALNSIGIIYNSYYSSEIDKNAISITQYNYPGTIQLGDIKKINCELLPKINLLFGGSPCTNLSKAGNGEGLDGNESKLFWEFIRILKEVKPDYFLLENVTMKREWEEIITNALGVKPIKINSKLVSAQSRDRLYWTNIPVEGLPKNKHIYLKDILNINTNKPLQDNIVCEKYIEKVNVRKYQIDIDKFQKLLKSCKTKTNNQISIELNIKKTTVDHWFRTDRCFSIPSSEIWFELKKCLNITTDEFDKSVTEFEIRDGVFDMANRVYHISGKSPTITATGTKIKTIDDNGDIRILSRENYEQLQTIPIGYTNIVSDDVAKKLIGNGWTIDVIAFLFSFLKNNV